MSNRNKIDESKVICDKIAEAFLSAPEPPEGFVLDKP